MPGLCPQTAAPALPHPQTFAFQGSPVSDPSQTKPQWLRDLYLPLDPQQLKSIAELYDGDISDEEEMFNKFELK